MAVCLWVCKGLHNSRQAKQKLCTALILRPSGWMHVARVAMVAVQDSNLRPPACKAIFIPYAP